MDRQNTLVKDYLDNASTTNKANTKGSLKTNLWVEFKNCCGCLLISFLSLLVLISIVVISFSFRERLDRSTFARKICDNMVNAGYISESLCIISEDVPTVIANAFPIGVSPEFVFVSLEGFQVVSDDSNSIDNCKDWRLIRFRIIRQWAGWDDNVVFCFCDNELSRWDYEN